MKEWNQGEIVQKCVEPNSYLVKADNDKVHRRTRNHLQICQIPDKEIGKVQETFQNKGNAESALACIVDDLVTSETVSKEVDKRTAPAKTPKPVRRSTRSTKDHEPDRLKY